MAFPNSWSGYYLVSPINPTGSVTGFVFSLDLQLLSGLNSLVKSDGSDIRVSDINNNQIPCDLIYYNNGYGLLNFSGNNSTGIQFKIWYGNSSATFEPATGTYGQYNVYNTGIYGYYPSGGGQDRTRYQRHLTPSGSVSGVSFTGSTISGIGYTRYTTSGTNAVSISSGTGMLNSFLSWTRTYASGSVQYILGTYGTGASNEINNMQYSSTSFRAGYAGFTLTTAGNIIGVEWSHNAVSITSSQRQVLLNNTTYIRGTGNVTPPANINTFRIGGMRLGSLIQPLDSDVALAQWHVTELPRHYMSYDREMGVNNAVFWNGSYSPNSELISVYINGISYTYTSSLGNLYNSVNILADSNTKTSMVAIITLTDGGITFINLDGVSSTSTSILGTIYKTANISGDSNAKINAIGALVKDIQLFGNGYNNTSALGMVTLTVSLDAISSTKTALTGFATLIDLSNQPDSDFEVTVYITIEKGKGLYICRQKDLNLFIARNRDNLNLYIAQGLILP